MKIVHFSDTHLGFRQFGRVTAAGLNQREADVARAFSAVVDATIAARPDLVVVGGDVFHSPRPANAAIMHAVRQFQRLADALPGVPIVIAAGNHDLPRTADVGSLLRLLEGPTVHVADFGPRRFTFPHLDLAVLAVPDTSSERPALEPDPALGHNVLVIHGEAAGVVRGGSRALAIGDDELGAGGWDYVALGHYHVYRKVADNAYYSGAPEYVSSDPWGEMAEQAERGIPGKGFATFDTESGVSAFHPIALAREFVDVAPIDAATMGPDELDAAIAAAADAVGGMDGKVVRMRALAVPASTRNALDHAALRALRAAAFHFQFEMTRPDRQRPADGRAAVEVVGQGLSLPDFIRGEMQKRAVPTDIGRDALLDALFGYLDKATTAEAAALGGDADA